MNRSLEERRQFVVETGCCGSDDGGGDTETPMDSGEEGLDSAITPLQGVIKKLRAKRKKND